MRKSGGFMVGSHLCNGSTMRSHLCHWTKQSKDFCLHVWLYVDSIDELEETCADLCFTGETLKDAIAKCKKWLADPKNLKPYQEERLGAIAPVA